ncbi:NAD-dependent epimerase/dehydratase family protein, partial [Nguyenibacter vanlangensis]
MATRRVATVIGGSGFLGRHVVQRLAEDGYVVRVVGRRADRAA